MEPWSREWKQHQLDLLYAAWENCQGCELHQTRKKLVFGEGNPDADILFIGEAPGEHEDKSGRPFVGDSGKLFDSMWCGALGQSREDIYITNIVACKPPKNRDPIAVEKDQCLPRVQEIIYIVDPLLIVSVGKFALNTLTSGRSWGIEKQHGRMFSSPHPTIKVGGEHNGVEIPGRVFPRKESDKSIHTLEYDLVPVFHTSYILRTDSYDTNANQFPKGGVAHQTLDDLQAVVKRVEQLKREYKDIPRIVERM